MKRRLFVRGAAALAAVLALTGCGARPSSEGGFVAGDGSLTRVEPAQRTPAPVIVGTTLAGQPWSSESVKGSVIVYNVWGSWCNPCRKEAPALQDAANRTKGRAVFVGLNTRDIDKAPARAFVDAFGITYTNLYDPDGRLLLGFAGTLAPNAIPSTIVVDAQGRVAARILGETTATTLVGLVDDVAGGR